MTTIKFSELRNLENDGLVFYGLLDELEEFKEIINNEINKSECGTGNFEDKFDGIYELKVPNGRRDIVLSFKKNSTIKIGKLAIWRLSLNGLASWISDYVENRANDFIN